MSTSDKAKNSLFDSILGTEAQAVIESEIHKHAQRVGIILKVTYGRQLDTIRESFISELSRLVQTTANAIDNELSKTEENIKS